MSLSPIRARLLAETGAFDEALRRAIAAINEAAPFLRRLALEQQRHRARTVTRRKQRRRW